MKNLLNKYGTPNQWNTMYDNLQRKLLKWNYVSVKNKVGYKITFLFLFVIKKNTGWQRKWKMKVLIKNKLPIERTPVSERSLN